jgi:hypothetical protein
MWQYNHRQENNVNLHVYVKKSVCCSPHDGPIGAEIRFIIEEILQQYEK